MTVAVIVTTYNRPTALAAVLDAFSAQDDCDFELLVADDGSTEETARLIDAYRGHVPFSLGHVWHEDRGFRAAAIRNRALAKTRCDYVIFSDGDCIPLRGFVGNHRALAESGWFVSGNRILMGEDLTRRVLDRRMAIHAWTAGQWAAAFFRRDVNRLLPLAGLPMPAFSRKMLPNRWQGVMTCNLACWRKDLVDVNGFDESYHGWGLEDTDLVVRLLRAGVHRKSARFAAPVLHLWHRVNDRQNLEENRRRLEEVMHSGRVRAIQGLGAYL